MLIYIMLAGAVLLGWLIRLVSSLAVQPPMVAVWLKLTSIVIATASVNLAVISYGELVKALEHHSWPTADAVVVASKVVGDRAYRPSIEFEYKVVDSLYHATSDMNAPGFGGKRKRFEVAEAWVKEYPPGSTIHVRYNPNNPGQALTSSGPTWNMYAQTGLGLFILTLAGFLITCPTRK